MVIPATRKTKDHDIIQTNYTSTAIEPPPQQEGRPKEIPLQQWEEEDEWKQYEELLNEITLPNHDNDTSAAMTIMNLQNKILSIAKDIEIRRKGGRHKAKAPTINQTGNTNGMK